MWYAVLCSLGGFGIGGVLFILLSITALVETVSRRRWGQAAVALMFSVVPFGVVALCVAAPGDQNVKLVVGFLLALLSLPPLLRYGAFFTPSPVEDAVGAEMRAC
jgi:hypothetical protein